MACVVAPFDQRYDAPLLAVRVTLPPAQNVVGPEGVTVAGAGVVTVTTTGADVAAQPLASVTVTEYVPAAVTVMVCVVAPFDQAYDDMPTGAVRSTLPPAQNVVGPLAVTVAGGSGRTLTVVPAEVAEQLNVSVVVTE
jgi:hypothetical protein